MNEYCLPKWWVCFFDNVCHIQDDNYCPDRAKAYCSGFLQALYDCYTISEEQGMHLYMFVNVVYNEVKYKNF